MKVRIHKGMHQIGGCVTEIIAKNTKIIIDFGEDLDDDKPRYTLKGLTDENPIYDAVFITHSHGDHIGQINDINKSIPIYVEKDSLKIHNLTNDFCNNPPLEREIKEFELSYDLENMHPIFDNKDIKVTPYPVDHSAYHSCMYLVESEGKKVLHTGDYRNHGRLGTIFESVLQKIGNVDLLITEGTTLTRSKSKSKTEFTLEEEAAKIFNDYDQVFILQSSTNLDRTTSYLNAAKKSNKKFILDLFSYHLNQETNYGINVDYKDVFVWISQNYKKHRSQEFKEKYMHIKTESTFSSKYVMQIKNSMIDDINLLKRKHLVTHACLVYSMWDQYIERDEKLQKFLLEILENRIDIRFLHTSGHADYEAMKTLNELANPKHTIIIHTEGKEEDKANSVFQNVVSLQDGEYFEL